HIKRLWSAGGMGRVLAVLLLIGASVGVSALRLGAKRAAVNAVTGCGLDEQGMKKRADSLLKALEVHYGAAKPDAKGGSRLVFEKFDIDYVSMYDPCYSVFGV